MRFPSFIRLPRNKRYEIKPRYYDPIKEEIEERTERIRRELQGESGHTPSGRISFERRAQPLPSAGMMQLVIAILLMSLIIGWLYVGNDILYYTFAAIPVYLFYRFRGLLRKR